MGWPWSYKLQFANPSSKPFGAWWFPGHAREGDPDTPKGISGDVWPNRTKCPQDVRDLNGGKRRRGGFPCCCSASHALIPQTWGPLVEGPARIQLWTYPALPKAEAVQSKTDTQAVHCIPGKFILRRSTRVLLDFRIDCPPVITDKWTDPLPPCWSTRTDATGPGIQAGSDPNINRRRRRCFWYAVQFTILILIHGHQLKSSLALSCQTYLLNNVSKFINRFVLTIFHFKV